MSKKLKRCPWPTEDPLMIAYHDMEWGVPLHDDGKIFEFLLLESMQAGLSWSAILKKRGNFRRASFALICSLQFSGWRCGEHEQGF